MSNSYPTPRKTIYALLVAALLILSCCVPAIGVATSADQDEIDALIAAWEKTYGQTEGWQFEDRAQLDSYTNGVPGDGDLSTTQALRVMVEKILADYATDGITVEQLKTFEPHFTFRVDGDSPQWQIHLLPQELSSQAKGFTMYMDARSGEVLSLIYSVGNG